MCFLLRFGVGHERLYFTRLFWSLCGFTFDSSLKWLRIVVLLQDKWWFIVILKIYVNPKAAWIVCAWWFPWSLCQHTACSQQIDEVLVLTDSCISVRILVDWNVAADPFQLPGVAFSAWLWQNIESKVPRCQIFLLYMYCERPCTLNNVCVCAYARGVSFLSFRTIALIYFSCSFTALQTI